MFESVTKFPSTFFTREKWGREKTFSTIYVLEQHRGFICQTTHVHALGWTKTKLEIHFMVYSSGTRKQQPLLSTSVTLLPLLASGDWFNGRYDSMFAVLHLPCLHFLNMTQYHQYISQISYNSSIPSNIHEVLTFPKLCYNYSLYLIWNRDSESSVHCIGLTCSCLLSSIDSFSISFFSFRILCLLQKKERGRRGRKRRSWVTCLVEFPAVYIFVLLCFVCVSWPIYFHALRD